MRAFCVECVISGGEMKRSKSYTWLSGLLKMKNEEPPDEEWGAVPWVRADPMQTDRSVHTNFNSAIPLSKH